MDQTLEVPGSAQPRAAKYRHTGSRDSRKCTTQATAIEPKLSQEIRCARQWAWPRSLSDCPSTFPVPMCLATRTTRGEVPPCWIGEHRRQICPVRPHKSRPTLDGYRGHCLAHTDNQGYQPPAITPSSSFPRATRTQFSTDNTIHFSSDRVAVTNGAMQHHINARISWPVCPEPAAHDNMASLGAWREQDCMRGDAATKSLVCFFLRAMSQAQNRRRERTCMFFFFFKIDLSSWCLVRTCQVTLGLTL